MRGFERDLYICVDTMVQHTIADEDYGEKNNFLVAALLEEVLIAFVARIEGKRMHIQTNPCFDST